MYVRITTFGTSLWGKGNSKRQERQLLGTSDRNVKAPEDAHSIPTQFEIRECRHNNFVTMSHTMDTSYEGLHAFLCAIKHLSGHKIFITKLGDNMKYTRYAR
jgi:hypothetical protein